MGDGTVKTIRKNGKEYTYFKETFYYAGKQYEVTGKTQKEAIIKADRKLQALENGDVGISGKMTVSRWAKEWLETYKKPVLTEKSYSNYKRHVDFICEEVGALRLTEVKDVHLQKILNLREGYSYSEAKHLRDTIKAIFKRARASRLIQYDPAEFLEMPQTTKGTRRPLTDYERAHFLKVAETHHAGLMFKVMLYCGLRTGEVVALSWKDVDFDKMEFKIVSAMESGKTSLKSPKTEAGIRTIPIPDDIFYELLSKRGGPFEPIFTQPTTGKRHTESSRDKAWKNILRYMDISMGAILYRNKIVDSMIEKFSSDLVPYCLRHTFCTDLRDKGVDLTKAAELMGHEDVSVTANIYTHKMSEKERRKVRERMNEKARFNGNNKGKHFDALNIVDN